MSGRRPKQLVDVVIASCADRHGVVTTAALSRAGLSSRSVQARVGRGVLVAGGFGRYVVVGMADRWTPLAVALARRPGVMVTGRTAAALWGLDAFDRPAAAVLVRPDLIGGRRVSPPATVREGFTVTTPVATLRELGALGVSLDRIERAMESALRQRLCTVAEVDDAGDARLARVVDRRGRHHPPTESDAETLFVQLCRRARLPDPVRQHVLDDHTRLDFWFGPEAGGPLAVEIDGVSTHATRDALQYDLNRQNRIVGARLPVLRFTYDDVTRRRRVTARVVAQALGSEGAAASMLPTMDAPSARRAAS